MTDETLDRRPLEWRDSGAISAAYASGQTGVAWDTYDNGAYTSVAFNEVEFTVAESREEGKRIVQMIEDIRNGSLFTTVVVQRDYLDELENNFRKVSSSAI